MVLSESGWIEKYNERREIRKKKRRNERSRYTSAVDDEFSDNLLYRPGGSSAMLRGVVRSSCEPVAHRGYLCGERRISALVYG